MKRRRSAIDSKENKGKSSKAPRTTKTKITDIKDMPVDLVCMSADAVLASVDEFQQSFELFRELGIPEQRYIYCLKMIFRNRGWSTDFKTRDEAIEIVEKELFIPVWVRQEKPPALSYLFTR